MQNSLTRWLLTAALALVSSAAGTASATANYQGLWFNPAESGWGINLAHQGDVIFASWFTYDLTGKGTWLVMTANKSAPDTYTGQLFQGTGPAFDAVPFPPLGSPGGATVSGLGGTGTLTFIDANNATFAYTVAGIAQTKTITRQLFGPQPTCTFGAQPNLALATNYTDLWWASPAGSEAGWGVNLTHQGDIIFATWFTFDHDRTPRWMVVQATKTGPGVYAGTQVYRLTGPAFNAVPFPALGSVGGPTGVIVGTASFTFSDGNDAMFSYTVDGVTQSKAITREVFVSPGTVCETPSTSGAEGVWFGTTADGRMIRAIVLDDGTYYVVYSFPGVRANAGVVQGSSSAANGTFASSDGADFPIALAAETAGSATPAAVSGTYVPRTSLQLSILESTATRTFTASYDPGFEQAANLAAAAGTYTGRTGHVSGAISATFTLDSSGSLVGHNGACNFTGIVTPHKSVNVFDWTIAGPNCIFGKAGASGVMYYDEVNRELNGFAPFGARADQFYLLGAKP
jgi:hypothetical protein